MTVSRIDQGMATDAARVLRGGDGQVSVTRELRTRYRQLRVMLRTAGLAATYAFIASKAADAGAERELARAYRKVAEALRERLSAQHLLTVGEKAGVVAVLDALGTMDPVTYARASAEAAAFAGWLSRLADAAWLEGEGHA